MSMEKMEVSPGCVTGETRDNYMSEKENGSWKLSLLVGLCRGIFYVWLLKLGAPNPQLGLDRFFKWAISLAKKLRLYSRGYHKVSWVFLIGDNSWKLCFLVGFYSMFGDPQAKGPPTISLELVGI